MRSSLKDPRPEMPKSKRGDHRGRGEMPREKLHAKKKFRTEQAHKCTKKAEGRTTKMKKIEEQALVTRSRVAKRFIEERK